MFKDVYKDKKVLVTGHTGFKGTWLCAWLRELGASVFGVSLPDMPHKYSHFNEIQAASFVEDNRFDICNVKALDDLIQKISPDFIFHLAGQAIVNHSYDYPLQTVLTNAIGSANILDCATRLDNQCKIVMITSDKVYRNKEWSWGYRETDDLGDNDPYSASKAMAELVIRSYSASFFNKTNKSNIVVSTARAGNVIGGGDWSTDRLIPDCVEAWSNEQSVSIRSPESTRPWQHVLEPLGGYLRLAEQMFVGEQVHGESFNFGPSGTSEHTVGEVVSRLSRSLPNLNWIVNDDALSGPMKESGLLKLDCDKAMRLLGWRSVLGFEPTIDLTADWYVRFFCKGEPAIEITFDHICSYHPALAKSFEGGMA